jgi:hypothetical protein
MHTHITLVGGQKYPVYLGIKAVNPDKVYFIHSSDSKEDAESIDREFPNISKQYKEFDPVSSNKVLYELDKLFKNLSKSHSEGYTYSLNITSGTKIWSIMFYSAAKQSDLPFDIYYVDQKSVVYNLETNDREKKTRIIEIESIDTVLRLNNSTPKKFIKYEDFTKDDVAVCQQIDDLISRNKNMFFALVDKARWEGHLTEWVINNNYLSWDKNNKCFEMSLGNYKKKLSSPNVRQLLLNTGWFEYKVATMLKKWDKCKEIYVGVNFPAKNNTSKNEIDIIVNAGSRLIFVECKTKIEDKTDLDKFSSATKNFAGSGTIKLFVQNESFDEKTLEKCDDNKITSYSLSQRGIYDTHEENLAFLLNNAINDILK